MLSLEEQLPAPKVSQEQYQDFRTERARLGKELDEASDEEYLAKQRLSGAQEKTRQRRKAFELHLQFAVKRLLHFVIGIEELREPILAPLLPGEVLNSLAGCGLLKERSLFSDDLSPLKVILPAGSWLNRKRKDGYNLTIVSGSPDRLLFGLRATKLGSIFSSHGQGRCCSAIVVATRGGSFVPCNSEFLPTREFGGVGYQADSIEDYENDDGSTRIVDMVYSIDRMTVWMPLVESSITAPLVVPQTVFHSFCDKTYHLWSARQPEIFYSDLQDASSSIRGPLRHTEPQLKVPRDIP
jgi:hypothetical protein